MKTFFLFFFLLLPFGAKAFDASIILMRGEVLVNGKQIEKKVGLNYGDKVEAKGEKSFVQIFFDGGSKLMLKDGSAILQKFKEHGTTINLIKGTIFSYVNKEAKREFRVKTNHAAMAVRGTKFYVMESDEESYLCVCDGVVRIQNKTGHKDIRKKQDIHATKEGALAITKANQDMWQMALDGFKMMDLPVK